MMIVGVTSHTLARLLLLDLSDDYDHHDEEYDSEKDDGDVEDEEDTRQPLSRHARASTAKPEQIYLGTFPLFITHISCYESKFGALES